MKPSANVNVGNSGVGLRGFRWNYRERKVGVYLTLRCPLQYTETGSVFWRSWETVFRLEPRGELGIWRDTYRYDVYCHRRLNVEPTSKQIRHHSWADLRLHYDHTPGYWEHVADLGGNVSCERWTPGVRVFVPGTTKVEHQQWWGYESETTVVGLPANFDLLKFHADVAALIAGCAARGRFEPVVDWITENSPDELSRLFTEPGPL